MKIAFTIHWYGGVSAGLPVTQDTYIAEIPKSLLPAEVVAEIEGKHHTVMTLSIVKEDKA